MGVSSSSPFLLLVGKHSQKYKEYVGLFLSLGRNKKMVFFYCAIICIEVELDKALPEAIQLELEGWPYV